MQKTRRHRRLNQSSTKIKKLYQMAFFRRIAGQSLIGSLCYQYNFTIPELQSVYDAGIAWLTSNVLEMCKRVME